jgi:histone H3/H4
MHFFVLAAGRNDAADQQTIKLQISSIATLLSLRLLHQPSTATAIYTSTTYFTPNMTTPTKVSSPIAAEAANDKENAKVDDNTANTTTTTTPKGPPSAIEFEPPLACVRRILKNSLPSSTNVGKDASAAFARASGIFIIYLTACANDFARENRRQTITANDVLAALKVSTVVKQTIPQ